MKTAISVPDATFARVDEAAARLGVSRSEFFSRAAETYLRKLEAEGTTAQINRVLDEIGDEPDENAEFLAEAARQMHERLGPW